MSDPSFRIEYPLFALKRGPSEYVGYDLSMAYPPQSGMGIPVFTTREKAARFLRYTETRDEVKTFDRVNLFRQFLRNMRDQGMVILFDLLPDQTGDLVASHVLPAATVLERFLPEPGHIHGYPVYVLKHREGFACLPLEVGGATKQFLAVFTDADLAERAVAAARLFTATPIADRKAFAQLVRSLPPDVEGAAFDPPDPQRGGKVEATLRHHLIANLEMEL